MWIFRLLTGGSDGRYRLTHQAVLTFMASKIRLNELFDGPEGETRWDTYCRLMREANMHPYEDEEGFAEDLEYYLDSINEQAAYWNLHNRNFN